jgi:hypothetical protein
VAASDARTSQHGVSRRTRGGFVNAGDSQKIESLLRSRGVDPCKFDLAERIIQRTMDLKQIERFGSGSGTSEFKRESRCFPKYHPKGKRG